MGSTLSHSHSMYFLADYLKSVVIENNLTNLEPLKRNTIQEIENKPRKTFR